MNVSNSWRASATLRPGGPRSPRPRPTASRSVATTWPSSSARSRSSVVHLLYTGELPDPSTARLVDAVMVAGIDHGAGAVGAGRPHRHLRWCHPAGRVRRPVSWRSASSTAPPWSRRCSPSAPWWTNGGRRGHARRCRRSPGGRGPGPGPPGAQLRPSPARQRDPRLDRLLAVAHEAGAAGDHLAAARGDRSQRMTGRSAVPCRSTSTVPWRRILGEVGFPATSATLCSSPRARRDPGARQRGTADDGGDAADRTRSTTPTAAPTAVGCHRSPGRPPMTAPPTAAEQLVEYLERRGRPPRLQAVRAHQHRRAGRDGQQRHRVRQRAPRAGRRPRRRRLRPGDGPGERRPEPPQPRPHQRRHRRRQRCPRLHPDGGDRRRRAVALPRPPPPGGEPARHVPARDLPAVRQAGLAGRQGRAPARGHGQGVPAGRERPARSGPGRRAHGRLLATARPRPVRPARPEHPGSWPGRRSTTRPPEPSSPGRRGRAAGLYVGGGVLLARAATSADASSTTRASRSPTA